MKTRHVFAIATAFCLFLPDLPGAAEIDRDRMQQDLDIMEGILKNLHTQTTTNLVGVHQEPQVRGLYFANYGVIFLIEERRSGYLELEVELSKYLGKPSKVVDEPEEAHVDELQQMKKNRVALNDRLAEFLGSYADGIRQLEDEDRITILVHHKPFSHVLPGVHEALSDARNQLRVVTNKQLNSGFQEQNYLEVTTKKRDIVAYRREKIDEAEFRKRIAFRDHRPDASTMKKIGVMATILDKALKQTEHSVRRLDGTLGIYQKGLGAIFFVNVRGGFRGTAIHVRRKNDPKAVTYQVRPGKAVEIGKKPKDRFTKELVEIVGDYGYTLRTLKPEEYIVVEVRFPKGMRRKTSDPRGLVLKVKKQDVDAYSGGDLDLAAFREKVDIQEY